MGTKNILCGLLFLLVLTIAGCEYEDSDLTILEISPSDRSTVIVREIDGIEFNFHLLNEDGNPSTVFNEGENFSFYFSVTNNRRENLYYIPEYAQSNRNNFCRVYGKDGQEFGKPFELMLCLGIGVGGYPFPPDTTYLFERPWIDNSEVWFWSNCSYSGTHREPLVKGEYFTFFKSNFVFDRSWDQPPLEIDTLVFRINFKII